MQIGLDVEGPNFCDKVGGSRGQFRALVGVGDSLVNLFALACCGFPRFYLLVMASEIFLEIAGKVGGAWVT